MAAQGKAKRRPGYATELHADCPEGAEQKRRYIRPIPTALPLQGNLAMPDTIPRAERLSNQGLAPLAIAYHRSAIQDKNGTKL